MFTICQPNFFKRLFIFLLKEDSFKIFRHTVSYSEISDSNFRCALWTFIQQLTWKVRTRCDTSIVTSYKRLCTEGFGICYVNHPLFVKTLIFKDKNSILSLKCLLNVRKVWMVLSEEATALCKMWVLSDVERFTPLILKSISIFTWPMTFLFWTQCRSISM